MGNADVYAQITQEGMGAPRYSDEALVNDIAAVIAKALWGTGAVGRNFAGSNLEQAARDALAIARERRW